MLIFYSLIRSGIRNTEQPSQQQLSSYVLLCLCFYLLYVRFYDKYILSVLLSIQCIKAGVDEWPNGERRRRVWQVISDVWRCDIWWSAWSVVSSHWPVIWPIFSAHSSAGPARYNTAANSLLKGRGEHWLKAWRSLLVARVWCREDSNTFNRTLCERVVPRQRNYSSDVLVLIVACI